MSLVRARDLFCVYPGTDGGVAALQGLTLDIDDGEVCVVLGPSGSGKTTLMRVIAGFERASATSSETDLTGMEGWTTNIFMPVATIATYEKSFARSQLRFLVSVVLIAVAALATSSV